MTEADIAAARAAELWERGEVERTIVEFGRGLDDGDWELYRSTLIDTVEIDFSRLTGFPEVRVAADLWTRFAKLALSPVRRHHQYSNFLIDVEEGTATATVKMVARHWKETDRGAGENTQYGWYEFGLRKEYARWKIARLKHHFEWISGNGALLDFADAAVNEVMVEIFAAGNRVNQSGPADAP